MQKSPHQKETIRGRDQQNKGGKERIELSKYRGIVRMFYGMGGLTNWARRRPKSGKLEK